MLVFVATVLIWMAPGSETDADEPSAVTVEGIVVVVEIFWK